MRRALTGIFIGIAVLGLLCGGLYVLGTRQIAAREPEQLSQVGNRISGRFLEVHGRRTHIVEQGVGPTLLLVHGFAASTFDWEEAVLPALAQEYHVVALDLYGMGFRICRKITFPFMPYRVRVLRGGEEGCGSIV